MCRLVVCGPDRQLEIAVPVQVPLADLLPTLLTYLGPDLADSGMSHAGWVLQRLGEPPLDADLGVGALGLRDGELVHLRPRADQLPPAAFDDLIDGIATGLRQRPGLWRPAHTRWTALTATALVLATGLVALAFPGPPQLRTATALLLALTSLAGTAVAARAVGDRSVAGILAAASVGYAVLAGLLAPRSVRPTRRACRPRRRTSSRRPARAPVRSCSPACWPAVARRCSWPARWPVRSPPLARVSWRSPTCRRRWGPPWWRWRQASCCRSPR
ncbi:type VII secretion integral membrane protein EccD [Micromonospora sp. Llam7]|nr:type VII secretion integral membrane protein EccD [Micromonospora tarapacensis]